MLSMRNGWSIARYRQVHPPFLFATASESLCFPGISYTSPLVTFVLAVRLTA